MNPFKLILNLVLPAECHICGKTLIGPEEFVCHDCLSHLPATGFERYWTNRTGLNSDLNPMEQRFAGQIPLGHACAPFFYTRDSGLASLIHDFKYRGFSRLAVMLGRHGAGLLKPSGFFRHTDIILPVPLHWTKKHKRGYNQSEMLARGISEATGIPVGKNLRAARAHRTQTSLNPIERMENTKGVFRVDKADRLSGKTVLLVDDICTTGATLLAAGDAVARAAAGVRLNIFTLGVV